MDYDPSKNCKALVTNVYPVQTGFADSLPKPAKATQQYLHSFFVFFFSLSSRLPL